MVSTAQICPNGRLDPHTSARRATTICELDHKEVGAQTGHQGPLGAEKGFFKKDPTPRTMPKQVFLADGEAMVAPFGQIKIPKCLENGLFWHQKRVKNVCFPKNRLRPFGVLKKVKFAHLQPIVRHLRPNKVTNCLENELFSDHKKRSCTVLGAQTREIISFEPPWRNFDPLPSPKQLSQSCHFGATSGSKIRKKNPFPKMSLVHFGCRNE